MTSYDIRYDAWCGWLMGLTGTGRRFSGVTLEPDRPEREPEREVDVPAGTVCVRMGWAFRAEVPLAAIRSVEPASHRRVWGWGVHGWRSRWLVNGSSRGLIRLTIDPPVRARVCGIPIGLRDLTVSLADPDRFRADVEAALG